MRLVMIGTGPFALPTYRAMYHWGHTVVALVTRPKRGHRRRVAPNRLRQLAETHGTPIHDPVDINANSTREQLREFEADLFVVCDFGQILSPETLQTARFGGVNLHGSLLPKYRGAAPIHWALYHGETETGASVIHMTPRVDAGPVIAQVAVAIDPEETAAELEPRLAELGVTLVREAIESIASQSVRAVSQDKSLASRAPRIKKTDGLIDWSRSARAIKNHVRAMQPWPKTFTFWHRADAKPLRLIVGSVAVLDPAELGGPPGTVLEADNRLVVSTGQGPVCLESLQPAGKKLLPVQEFLRGYHVRPGDRFGPE